MSLNARLALSLALLVACAAGIGLAGLRAVDEQVDRVRAAQDRYAALRDLYEVGHHAATARTLAELAPGRSLEFRRELLAGLHKTEQLLLLSPSTTESSIDGTTPLAKDLQELRTNFEEALSLDPSSTGDAAALAPLQASLGRIASLAGGINRDILTDRQMLTTRVEQARMIFAAVFGGTLLMATVIGVLQHRAVARPLRTLRRGMDAIAENRLDARLPMNGPREFRRLIHQFNCMAARVESLQSSLHKQVDVKTRQLIVSERLAGLGYMAAGLAHEMNNPLGIIGGYAETLQRRLSATRSDAAETSVDPDVAEALDAIAQEAFHCRDITSRMLDLARTADEPDELIDLDHLVHATTRRLRHLPLCRGRRIILDEPATSPRLVRGSRRLLSQVFMNLIVNALQAVEAGDGSVGVSVASQAGSILVRVADNGCGLDAESLRRVFEPLVSNKTPSGDPSRSTSGFGLGLSIAHSIVERHGGRIDAASEGRGMGCVFTVELPAAATLTSSIA